MFPQISLPQPSVFWKGRTFLYCQAGIIVISDEFVSCWLPNYLNMKVNNLITLNEKVIAQVWIKSIQITCYDFYNIFYRKWEKEKRVKPTHANEFFLLSALTNKILITVYKSNVNQVDAESYKKFTESLNLYSLICPKCKHHDFQKHGYYTRKVKYRKHSVTFTDPSC